MPTTIFHTESGNTESWLEVNDDGTITYHKENAGWRMAHRGIDASEKIITAEEAKKRWPTYANAINEALAVVDKTSDPSN